MSHYPFEIVSSDADKSVVSITCPFCGKTFLLKVSNAGLQRYACGDYVQNAFPELNADDREMFISGICAGCFPKPPDEEEDDADDLDSYDYEGDDADEDEDPCSDCGDCDDGSGCDEECLEDADTEDDY